MEKKHLDWSQQVDISINKMSLHYVVFMGVKTWERVLQVRHENNDPAGGATTQGTDYLRLFRKRAVMTSTHSHSLLCGHHV